MAKLPAYEMFLGGFGIGSGYAGGVLMGAAKEFVMNKLGEAMATGNFYKAVTDSLQYGYSLGSEGALIGAFTSILLGLTYKEWGVDIFNFFFGKKKKDVDIE